MTDNLYTARGETAPGGQARVTTLAATIAKFGTISNTLALACALSGSMQARRTSGDVEDNLSLHEASQSTSRPGRALQGSGPSDAGTA